eukprot:232772_1
MSSNQIEDVGAITQRQQTNGQKSNCEYNMFSELVSVSVMSVHKRYKTNLFDFSYEMIFIYYSQSLPLLFAVTIVLKLSLVWIFSSNSMDLKKKKKK